MQKQNIELTNQLQKANEHIEFLTNITSTKVGNALENKVQTKQQLCVENLEATKINSFSVNSSIYSKKEHEKMNQLDQLTENLSLKKDNIIERLIKSVQMVKEVLKSNMDLRDIIANQNKELEQDKAEINHLRYENEELVDRITILEENSNHHSNHKGKNEIESKNIFADEYIGMKKNNKILDMRIKELESENEILKRKRWSSSNEYKNSDFEPVKASIKEEANPSNNERQVASKYDTLSKTFNQLHEVFKGKMFMHPQVVVKMKKHDNLHSLDLSVYMSKSQGSSAFRRHSGEYKEPKNSFYSTYNNNEKQAIEKKKIILPTINRSVLYLKE